MEKTEMMYRFEQETSHEALVTVPIEGDSLLVVSEEYARWMETELQIETIRANALQNAFDRFEAKASAYDRLMSGGKVSYAKDAANFYGRPVASVDREWRVFENMPVYDGYRWWDMKSRNCLDGEPVPFDIKPFDGDEADSLTLPDGWYE